MNSKRISYPTEKAQALQELQCKQLKCKANNIEHTTHHKQTREETTSTKNQIIPEGSTISGDAETNTTATNPTENGAESLDDMGDVGNMDREEEQDENLDTELGMNILL
jgi:hypothetical protein